MFAIFFRPETAALLALFISIASHATADGAIYVTNTDGGMQRFSNQPERKESKLFLPPSAPLTFPASLSIERRSRFLPVIQQAAQTYDVDPILISALIEIESAFDPNAVSPKGAKGLMQLIPQTAARYGVKDVYDVRQNVDGGTRYLRDLLAIHNGNLALTLAAYNAGQTNIKRHQQRIPPFSETMLYVPKVLAKMAEFERLPLGNAQ